jgi:hypothetical protein
MDFEEIKNMATNGVSYINPNPSRSKKHPSPKILNSLDPIKIAELTTGFADREINEGLTSGKVLTNQADKADQLRHYGVTPNASIVDVDKVLAESQSNLRKLGSAVSQAVVSEIGLGTVRGAADLFDFIGNAVTGNLANNDYTNPVSEKIQEWQDYFNTEVAPIYADPNLDITNGGLTDFGWWASNMPSIMSSVTLLLPSTAATKGLQWLAKASAASKLGTATRNGIKALVGIDRALGKEGRTLNKFQQGVKTLVDAPINGLGARTGQFVETGLNAALSRTMENYQEAQGVYSDVFNTATDTLNKMTPQEFTEFVNKNQDIYDEAGGDNASKKDIAKVIAQKSANQDFLTNYVNIGSDILQLYGLRNMWKGLKNGVSSSTLTSAARNARRTLGKTPEEIAEMEAKQSFLKKAGQKIIDKALDEKTVVAGELSEGLEEAVNYIAQMEGTHLGNVYLGLESDSAFDDRLQKYMRSGGLWDSAFWGVMGGVVFHHLGSGFGRISQTLKDKADSKTDERTGEGKPKSMFSLSETSEIKARKANIESWNNSIENYWNQMSQIKDGNNPFSVSNEDKTFNNDLDKEAAAQRAYDELLTGMTLNAAHNGNLGMLRSYMASDDVRKAMVNKGVTDEANSKADQQKALDKMDEVTASYEAELKKLVNLSEAVRVTKHTDDILPIEFLQSIASNNVINKQYNDKINAQIDELDKQIGTAFDNEDIKNILGQDYTPEQYQIVASTALLTNELRTLQAERSRLLSDKKKMNNISTKVAVDNINKLMNKYQDMIDTNTLRYSLHEALQGAYNDEGKVQSFANQASTTLANLLSGTSNSGVLLNDENIISGLKKFAEKFSVSPRIAEFENPTDIVNQVREHGSYLRKINRKLQATDKVGVNGTDGTLSALLVNKTALELRRAYNESKMVNNADELATEISFMNNTMNEGRKKAIDSAYETITKLSDKYGNDKFAARIGDAIGAYYQRSKDDIDSILDFMSEDDKSALNDALDVLNLTKGKNYRLGEQIQGFLSLRQDIFDSQEREESHNVNNPDDSNNGAEPESTTTPPPSTQTTSNPASQATQPQQPINQPASTPQSPTAQGNTPTGNSQPQSAQPMARNEVGERVTEFLNNNKAVSPTNVKTDSNTGVISAELAIDDNASQEDKVAFMSNADLFENPELANTPGATVGSNPKFDYDDNSNPTNIRKGKISVMAKPMSGVTSNASTPSTGGLENNNTIKTSIDNYYNITKKYENDSSDNYTWNKLDVDDLSNLHVGDLIRVDHKKMGDIEDDTLEKYTYYAVSKIYKDKDIVGYRVLVNDYTSIKNDVASPLKKVLIPKSESVIPRGNIGFVEVGTRDVSAKVETKGIDRAELTANFMGELRTSGKEIKAGNLTAENFIKHLQDEGIELGATQEDIDGAINSVKAVMNNLLGTAFASSVGEVMLASAVEEYKPSLSFGNEYKDAANNMLKNYASEVKLRQHNGKYYGNLEDLLRYINEHSPSKNTADFIYNSLKEYLKTEEGKKQFVMLDADSVDDAEFMTNVRKTAGERRAEAIKAGTLKRVNIRELSEVVPPDRINASRDELDKIKEGDKLTVKKANKLATNTDVLLVQHNGTTVGWMGIPTFDVSTGRYIQVNDCIKYTVGRSAEYDGAVKDWILSIADPKDEDSRKLNDLLYKIAFDKKYDSSFVEKFKNNPRVQEAVNNNFIVINEDKGFTYAKALDGMVKLWRYNPNVSSFNPIPESINLFFDNLRISYQTSLALINNNQELTVSKISKGELLRLAPHGTPGEAFRFAQPASIAISSKTDARIALARNLSQIEVSGKQTNDNLGFKMNQTLIAIDNGNGTIDYTNAYPVNWGVTNYEKDGKLVNMPHSKVLADLTNAIEGQIIDRLTNLQKGDSLTNWNEFRSFLDTLLDYNNNSTLFKTSGVFHRNNGLTYINAGTKAVALYACDTKRTGAPTQLVFMEHGKKVSSYSLLDNGAEAGKALVQFLRENATVNFAHELLTSDNNTSVPLKGFVSRNADGKLVINIPEYNGKNGFNHVEESYNDFMIKNDLLRVDLSQVDGSNYSRFSSNMKANSVLEFTVGDEVKQEEEKPLETPRKGNVNTNTTDQVKSIIESDSKTKGLDIAKAILSEEAVNLLNNAGKLTSILPENVIFANDRIEKFRASEKNNNINAMYEKGDIVVGDDFFKETSGRQVRILIHEGLHKRLHDYGPSQHRKFLNNMTEIYDDFSKAIDEDLKDIADGNIKAVRERRNFEDTLTDEAITDWLKYIDSFKFKEYVDRGELNRAKEEFIVESLTNVEFIDYLNKVKVDNVGDKSRHRTAWQMIMDFINKLFRLDIAEGSLREKEYNAFAKALSIDKNADTNVQTETEPTIEESQDEEVEGKVVEDETPTPGVDKDISNGVDLDDVYDDDDDVNLSSRSEYPSLYSTIESLPMEQHSQFATLLASGDISITCK